MGQDDKLIEEMNKKRYSNKAENIKKNKIEATRNTDLEQLEKETQNTLKTCLLEEQGP